MFDIGFAELLIIGVVALLVIGPERLPEAIRTASAWLSRLRRGFNDIKREVQQDLHNDAVMRDLRDSGRAIREETEALRRQFSSPLDDLAASASQALQGQQPENARRPGPDAEGAAIDSSAGSRADTREDTRADTLSGTENPPSPGEPSTPDKDTDTRRD